MSDLLLFATTLLISVLNPDFGAASIGPHEQNTFIPSEGPYRGNKFRGPVSSSPPAQTELGRYICNRIPKPRSNYCCLFVAALLCPLLCSPSCKGISLNFINLESFESPSYIEGLLHYCHLTTVEKHGIISDHFAECVGMCQCILNEVSVLGRACHSCVKEQILHGRKDFIHAFTSVEYWLLRSASGTSNDQQQTTSMTLMSSSTRLLPHLL